MATKLTFLLSCVLLSLKGLLKKLACGTFMPELFAVFV